ncbi:MAG: cytochrome c1 [Xanthomonadales bacterium]|nr:cytochrome c1 [Gammaproteobacteria bacterium]NNE05061.1 cytochrome c1 [Xanthomonadales bacterium]NNL96118.1 cytochrome c1 [Xanthomonadales bacterium]
MNTINPLKSLLLATVLLSSPMAQAAGDAAELEPAGINITDLGALQRGAKLFVNYCFGCHSADYMRYNRLSEDLALTEDMVIENLVFSDAKIGETMSIAMDPDQGEAWFGKAPPDLSLVGRSRGADWLYGYMRSFYQDDSGAWNNTVLANASMPHVWWQLQGIQKAIFKDDGHGNQVFDQFELVSPGSLSPQEYDNTVRDLVTFLDYMGEPAKLKRKSIGIWVILFLSVFAFLAYLLKAEYWRDVH